MVRTHPKPVWHLMRGQKLYSRISDRELLLLAELGHLQAGDLLWRPGLGGWRSAESVPGVLAPPPFIAQPDATKISALLSEAWKAVIRWQVKLTLIAKQHARSIKLHLPRNYPRWQKFNLGDFLPRMLQHQGSLVGLLIVLVLGGLLTSPCGPRSR